MVWKGGKREEKLWWGILMCGWLWWGGGGVCLTRRGSRVGQGQGGQVGRWQRIGQKYFFGLCGVRKVDSDSAGGRKG